MLADKIEGDEQPIGADDIDFLVDFGGFDKPRAKIADTNAINYESDNNNDG